ncbi:YihY/virulence factor BrkB family protein [Flexivirga endophytica]|uniref:YihY/virulence factor BrkB family protein n=1 Tax=Flexivirga endophytica TaxID=1849103 RepID=UPI001E64C48C|nr:YihY/virulence factor BrkB family protein [Flexivirga endophytica]
MSAHSVVDQAQRRFPPLGYPIAVVYKFFDDMGNYLGALLAFYAFVSLFPLLILGSTILGVVLSGDAALQQRLIESALNEFPIINDQLASPNALSGSWMSITVSTVVALYGALGSAQAFQYIANSVWQVPRNARPNPFAARGKSVGLIALLGTALLATIGLTTVMPRLVHLAGLASFGVKLGTVGIDVVAFMVAYHVATSRSLRWRDIWPGAVFASVMWQVLQRFGNLYVEHVVQRNKETGTLAVVLGLMLLLFIAGIIIVLSMEINAVWTLRLWPRALLTPFTDNVELTDADVRAYGGLARATRLKGFQQIEVGFDRPPELPESPESDEDSGHEALPLPLDFGDGDEPDGPSTGPQRGGPTATEPMPTRASQAPDEAHRLPARHHGAARQEDERTIPLVRRHSEAVETTEAADDEDTAPVIRGPWSAER